MKFKLKTLFACLALTMGFTGCVNDDPDVNKGNKEGEKTYMTVTLNFPKSELRATNDPNATEMEAKINTVDVFIYGPEETGYYLSRTHLTGADFTQVTSGGNADKYTLNSTAQIETTTGEKQIFVAVNLPSDFVLSLEHKGTNELTQVAKKLIRSQLATTTGIAMTSEALITRSFVANAADPANNPEIPVKRMVAKVTVQMGRPMVQAGVPGKLSNLSFAVDNFNEHSFLIQKANKQDPNWANGSYVPTDFSRASATDYVLVSDSLISDVKKLNALYAAENTSEYHAKKEITRAIVRGAFIPDKVTVYRNGNYVESTSTAEGITAPKTFWTVTIYNPSPEMRFFYTETVANNYKTYITSQNIYTGNVTAYTDGLCYWDIYLNKNVWDVYRNDYYRSTITRIVAPGRNTPDIIDEPDLPPATDMDITVAVDVLNWISVTYDYELEP